jgi:lipopolysaccharide transport system ATP-binding protein
VIDVRGVSKAFSIPHQARRTLFHRLFGGGYSYETFHALRDVSLRVDAGEFVGLVGRNGSGKSTLLRIVAGIYLPSAGSVSVGGEAASVLELGVGFQGGLRVRDNVFLYGVLLGIPRRRLRLELDEILRHAGVERFADARLDALSSGLRLRLAYTLALRADAPLLLLDEALTVGDEAFRRRCVGELLELRARGRTALLASHDAELLQALCGRVVVLDQGGVRGDGEPGRMLDLYRSLA